MSEGDTRPASKIGSTIVGSGRNVKLTVYAPEGTRAQFEIAVSSYAPIDGTVNEFLLVDPEIRMRTNSGNAVRVTARQGVVEAQTKAGGALVPQRGRLSGDVLIEADRLSEQERRKLPEARRLDPAPAELLQVRTDEIVFDRETSRLSVPGEARVSGYDVEVLLREVEVRFDQGSGRVESIGVSRGGRIELREAAHRLDLAIPGVRASSPDRVTVVEWLRATLQTKLASVPQQKTEEGRGPPRVREPGPNDGVPVFRGDQENRPPAESPSRYFARFEDQVRVSQEVNQEVRSRLEAAVLEVLRQFGNQDRALATGQDADPKAPADSPADGPDQKPKEVIVLEWAGRLNVEAVTPNDSRWPIGVGSLVQAMGAPVHIVNAEGEAQCSRLLYEPQESTVTLSGDETAPVVVRSSGQGTLRGRELLYTRRDEEFGIQVAGPGVLEGFSESGNAILPGTIQDAIVPEIRFADSLEVRGRYAKIVSIELSGSVSSRQQRRFDEARFLGLVRAVHGGADVSADEIRVLFQPARRSGPQAIDRMFALGNVVLADGRDRLSATEVEMEMAMDAAGEAIPLVVTARKDVVANQGERMLRAAKELIVDFEPVSRVAVPETDEALGPIPEGSPAGAIGKRNSERAPKGGLRTDATARRLRAYGDVFVRDPVQSLDVSAEEIDCTIRNGQEVENAVLLGSTTRPATAQLKALSVAGGEIKLQVMDEWAEVPGPGRMTFRSNKDLDGRKRDQPMPVAVTWTQQMKYRGRENAAVFFGAVHAASETGNTFDAERVELEFEDVLAPSLRPRSAAPNWFDLQKLAARWMPKDRDPGFGLSSKQLAALLATGNVLAVTSEPDPLDGTMRSRSSIRGPKLALNLRDEVSKLTVEGQGSLLLEDFRPASSSESVPSITKSGGLLDQAQDSGPSKTAIQWSELMWYDFSIQQTRFEGDVVLKHFSGGELARLVRMPVNESAVSTGTSTFLSCEVLSADFQRQPSRAESGEGSRMGRLGAARLRQFHARGNVALQSPSHHLSLNAEGVTFEKDRNLLAILGSQSRAARILLKKPGEYPQDLSVARCFFDLAANSVEFAEPMYKRRSNEQ